MARKSTPPSTTKRRAAPKQAQQAKPARNTQPKRGSSTVERRGHPPADGGSTPPPATSIASAPQRRLTPNQELFVHEYLKDRNGTQAYLRVFPNAKARSARTEAWRLLTNPDVRRALEVERVKHIRNLSMDRERLIGELVAIATADPNDLIEYRRCCCPECYPAAEQKPGIYDPPDVDCKACAGEGIGREIIKDTRFLSPEARALYAGVKVTRDGMQVLMRDQDGAVDRLARVLGVFEADNKQGPAAFARAMADFMAHVGTEGSRLPIAQNAPRDSTGGS